MRAFPGSGDSHHADVHQHPQHGKCRLFHKPIPGRLDDGYVMEILL
jgi:hypothetical protein